MAFVIPSLFEPDLKRQRANMHLHALNLEIAHFCNNNPHGVTAEEDGETREYVVRLTHPQLANAIIAVLTFGDFVSNLRICLDYLAWQLVLQNGRTPTMTTTFPITHLRNHSGRRMLSKATVGMSEGAISIIDSFQPYHAGNDYKLSHLWRLATFSNIQKHRHISAFAAQPPWQFRLDAPPTGGPWNVRTAQVNDCTEIRFPFAAKDYISFNPEGNKTELRFIDSTEGLDVGYQDLLEMYNFIHDEVIPAFTSIFPNPDVPWCTPHS